jgi:outer membrane protein assembly factor BamB
MSTSTAYNDVGLTSSTAYSYTVSACGSAGNYCSAQSAPVSVTTPKWIFSIPALSGGCSAIGTDGTIYVGGSALYAINPNGTQKWAFPTGGETYPAIDANGIIYVGGMSGSSYVLYAINPNGTQKWAFVMGGIPLATPAIDANGNIYVSGSDGNLYAVSPTGTLNWTFATGNGAPIIGADGTIYVGGSKLYAINPNGTQKWVLALVVTTDGAAIDANGIIYASNGSILNAINPNGTQKWAFAGGKGSVAIGADGTIYEGGNSGTAYSLYAINPDGTQKWAFTGAGSIPPIIDSNGTIYTTGAYSVAPLYAINPDGTQKWAFAMVWAAMTSSIDIGADGTIYLVVYMDDNGLTSGIYALPGTTPLANSPWPKYHRDLQNTGRYP